MLLVHGILTQYMQNAGDIIIRPWFGCEATRMPQEGSVVLFQFYVVLFLGFSPKVLILGRLGTLSSPMTIEWPHRASTAVIHILQVTGNFLMTAVGARPPQEKNKVCGKRRRKRLRLSQTGR